MTQRDSMTVILHDIEEWSERWAEELRTAFHVMTRHCEVNGYSLFENLSYDAFVEFVYDFSSGRAPSC